MIYFMAIFLAVVVYALWPSNAAKFDEAARMPLKED
ncbi:MAG: cbb3-type cytochrome c oxidase subunit 3 [Beijerinckiaceae bacterium]